METTDNGDRFKPVPIILLKGADAVVLAVRHQAYLKLDPDKVIKMTGRPVAIIDCFGILTDAQIRRYFELGCEVKGLAFARVNSGGNPVFSMAS